MPGASKHATPLQGTTKKRKQAKHPTGSSFLILPLLILSAVHHESAFSSALLPSSFFSHHFTRLTPLTTP